MTFNFNLLVQNEASPQQWLHQFTKETHSVLAGLRAYWQGVDVVGEALKLVCMAKLPFAVYTDPLVAARSRVVERQGSKLFDYYLLPEMLLALVLQSFGAHTSKVVGTVLTIFKKWHGRRGFY